jgi:hypothetical protein
MEPTESSSEDSVSRPGLDPGTFGPFPSVYIGRSRRIRMKDVENYVNDGWPRVLIGSQLPARQVHIFAIQ